MSQDNSQNKPHRATIIIRTIKVSVLIFALIVAPLFALNGRYVEVGDYEFLDKWTKTIIAIDMR